MHHNNRLLDMYEINCPDVNKLVLLNKFKLFNSQSKKSCMLYTSFNNTCYTILKYLSINYY